MIQDANLVVLQKMLDASTLRHRAIAQNLANVETPGYRRRVVRFQERLAEALAAGRGDRVAAARPEVSIVETGVNPMTDNNVEPDAELAAMMENALLYRTCSQLLSARIAGYRAAITGQALRG
ncbi:MAG: flagellar basal body rod protein FlgB [Planctomycetota bacterium]